MMPNIFSFFIYRLFAINAGEDVNRANQLALVGSLMKSPVFAAVLIHTLAVREVQTSAPSAPPPAVTAPPSGPETGSKTIDMPWLKSTPGGKTRYLDEANSILSKKGFQEAIVNEFFVKTAEAGVVIEQSPPPKTPVIPAETEVTLTVTSGSGTSSANQGVGKLS